MIQKADGIVDSRICGREVNFRINLRRRDRHPSWLKELGASQVKRVGVIATIESRETLILL